MIPRFWTCCMLKIDDLAKLHSSSYYSLFDAFGFRNVAQTGFYNQIWPYAIPVRIPDIQ